MNKFNRFALMSAIALTGAAGFTACSSEDELTNTNPTFDGESVKTQFAINIPYAKGQGTRLGEGIVQGQSPTPTFRGMSKIKLIPFASEPNASTAFSSDAIVLEDILGSGDESLNGGAKFYTDVAVPLNTSYFLFYAEATPAAASTDKDNGAIVAPTEFDNGDLMNSGLANTSALTFKLNPINGTANTEIQAYLLSILNGVTGVLYANMANDEDLTLAYNNISTLKAGSGALILATMQELYDIVKDGTGETADSKVKTEIEKYFTVSEGKLSYNTSITGYVEDSDVYPTNLGLPAGAAQLKFTSGTGATGTFAYDADNYSATFANYTYPASLYYYQKTALGASNATHGESWSGNNATDWATFVGTTNYPDNVVKALTQSIVLKEPIDYAVSRFDVLPRFADAEIPDAHGVNRAVGSDNFKLKAILVGQQNPVDYSFTFKALEGDEKVQTIYDASITETAITTNPPTTPFYTLTLESEKRSETTTQKTVNFALEMVNNGEAFYGSDGLVPTGGTFYLVGTLSTKQSDTENNYVFEKDHHTVANVTISSLATAKNVVPDLRQTQLELGLYVDLTWEEGLVYDVEIK